MRIRLRCSRNRADGRMEALNYQASLVRGDGQRRIHPSQLDVTITDVLSLVEVITGTPCVDPAVIERSMRPLKRIAEEEDAIVLFHHDAGDWKTYKMAPDYYD